MFKTGILFPPKHSLPCIATHIEDNLVPSTKILPKYSKIHLYSLFFSKRKKKIPHLLQRTKQSIVVTQRSKNCYGFIPIATGYPAACLTCAPPHLPTVSDNRSRTTPLWATRPYNENKQKVFADI